MSAITAFLRKHLSATAAGSLKRSWDRHFKRPVITRPWLEAADPSLRKPLLICVESSFSQKVNNAEHLTPLSFARGWTRVAGPAKFIYVKDLLREVDGHDQPAIFMSQLGLRHFSLAQARQLRGRDLFVWVHVHPRSFRRFEQQNPLVPRSESDMYLEAYTRLLLAEPKFVWNAVGAAGMEWFDGWRNDGLRWESIFPGANTELYYPDYDPQYERINVGYVGGYWEEKAQAFEMYFRPIESNFVPFGYGSWPYQNYAGAIDGAQERRLYSSARMIPLVTSPAGWAMAEVTERYVKAPACRAFCVADQNPAVRELFGEEEILQARSAEHFIDLVHRCLRGQLDLEHWREAAYRAVLSKHTVEHRAMQIVNALASGATTAAG